jgi:hypothetical protein
MFKNAQMQGSRNPEGGVATNKERLLPRRQVGEPAGGVLGGTLQRRRIRGTPQMGVFQHPARPLSGQSGSLGRKRLAAIS